MEDIIEPELPIIDPHHHFWDHRPVMHLRPQTGTLFDELMADIASGHNIRATVFLECHALYRADGPQWMKCVGETEFVNGVAAMSASGIYGPQRACAGIVGSCDLRDRAMCPKFSRRIWPPVAGASAAFAKVQPGTTTL